MSTSNPINHKGLTRKTFPNFLALILPGTWEPLTYWLIEAFPTPDLSANSCGFILAFDSAICILLEVNSFFMHVPSLLFVK